MKTIDTKGLKCPKPLIMLKEAIQDLKEGEQITVYTDNDTSLKNLVTYLKDHGVDPEVSTEGKVHKIVTSRPGESLSDTNPDDLIVLGLELAGKFWR